LTAEPEHQMLFMSDAQPVRNRMYVVALGYFCYSAVAFVVFAFLDIRGNPLKWAFLAVMLFGVTMAVTLLVQTRVIRNIVVYDHGILVPYHARHPIPAFTGYNKIIPWKDIIGVERHHGLRLILGDGRDFLILIHHDQLDELEALLRQKFIGK